MGLPSGCGRGNGIMLTTETIATYAALVATAAFVLEVRRWFDSRPRLVVSADTGYKITTKPLENSYLSISVVNRGSAPTIIRMVSMHYYKNSWDHLRRKVVKSFVIPRPAVEGTIYTLPYKLDPNGEWSGHAIQNSELDEMIEKGALYVRIHTTHRDRAYSVRVKKPKHFSAESVSDSVSILSGDSGSG